MFNVICIAFFAVFFSTGALADTPRAKLVECKKTGDIQQCKYQTAATISYVITPMPYALCAQAKCTINASDTKMASCQCPIYGIKNNNWQSISISDRPYADVRPGFDGQTLKQVTSNFSLAMAASNTHVDVTHTICKHSSPKPWANCFGVRCEVVSKLEHGIQKQVANCHCPVESSSTFLSSGPESTKDCDLGPDKIWSAATGDAGMGQYELIMQVYKNYKTPPKKDESNNE